MQGNPDQTIHHPTGARWAEVNGRLVVAIANAPKRPRWNRGDFFGDTFGK